jgi:hypothetical protein
VDVADVLAEPRVERFADVANAPIAASMSRASSTTTATSPSGVLWIQTASRVIPARSREA